MFNMFFHSDPTVMLQSFILKVNIPYHSLYLILKIKIDVTCFDGLRVFRRVDFAPKRHNFKLPLYPESHLYKPDLKHLSNP